MRERYKGFDISSASHQIGDSGKWTVDVVITAHKGDQTIDRKFAAKNVLRPSKDEADRDALAMGRRIIDGEVAEVSMDDV